MFVYILEWGAVLRNTGLDTLKHMSLAIALFSLHLVYLYALPYGKNAFTVHYFIKESMFRGPQNLMMHAFPCVANALLLRPSGNRLYTLGIATFGKWRALLTAPEMLST